MTGRIAAELRTVVQAAAARLKALDEAGARARPDPTKWSIEEIVGHLVDSASNNHQRFVRAQEVDPLVFPRYEQDHWVRVQAYNELPWHDLVDLWSLYNRHLAEVIARIPQEKLSVECRIEPYPPVSLEYLAEDYLVHLKHHVEQIEQRLLDRRS